MDPLRGGPVRQPYLTYQPARLHRLAESISWNRFLSFINIYKFGFWIDEKRSSVMSSYTDVQVSKLIYFALCNLVFTFHISCGPF
jgi:hypothetical protein